MTIVAPFDREWRRRVINEEVFSTAVHRERKRADRGHESLFLLRITIHDESAGAPATWARVIDAVTSVTRRSDVLGWCTTDAVLGLLVPEVRPSDVALSRELPRRFHRELEKRFGAATAAHVLLRVEAHPCPSTGSEPSVDDVRSLDEGQVPTSVAGALYPDVKRACDVLGSVACLLLFSPLLAVVAALVKLNSRGPVLFRQERVGHKEKPFTLLKFRTMYVDADHTLHQRFVSWFITSSDVDAQSRTSTTFKLYDDPRVTRVGAFLRKTSLDELPQLWNVLRGDMSLVGPRPPIDYEVRQYEPWHRRRVTDVKPGMTGLWQVAGRSRTTFDQMVRLDLRYARTCSLWSDLKILAMTPAAMISGKGAR
jgi:lipopolysaccharide/colanic/teichoic acid biosynthesis glycosyltransferase